MKIKNIAKLLSAIIICQLAGVIGSIFTSSSVETWYAELTLPSFAPPGWFIGAVWITLYTLMGISLYLIWNKGLRNKSVKEAVSIFFIQLVLNSVWSFLFFGLQSPFIAFIEIIILWIAILFTVIKFYRISKNASLLLIPYIMWVSVALLLNFSIWLLNP
jgi:tryptophan-rich sensory protein